jgi:NADH-quinone oxidoreductase subunit N
MTLSDLTTNTLAILPLVFVIAWACLLLLVNLFIPKERKGWTALFAVVGLLIALVVVILQAGEYKTAFDGMVVVDGFAIYLNVLFLISGVVAVALAYDYLKRMEIERGEYYVLLLFSISGMMLMAMAGDLILIFLALELLSIPLYIMAAFARPRPDSEEAGLKYFLLGAFAGGFLVYGVALIFGATATTALDGIVESIQSGSANLTFLTVGAIFILVGLGFKIAAVPFHMWTPDVYHGSPSAVTAFMAVGAKAGGFAALLRILIAALQAISSDLTPVLWVIAAATMILGNLVAIAQRNIKRMLAYSSIAHAGYILMALVPYGQRDMTEDSVAAVLFYLVAYAFTSFGAWAIVIALEKAEGHGLELNDYAGLGHKYPLLAIAMSVFMLSFIGIPPTLGFMGKFFIFSIVIDGGYTGLAIIGALTALISAYYYLRVVIYMFMREGEPQARKESWLGITAIVSAVAVVLLSIFSAPLIELTSRAIMLLY